MTDNEIISKLKLENEALYKINKKSEEEIRELRTELIKRQNLEESFCKTTNEFDKRLSKTVRLERAEAIKEFAERLKTTDMSDTVGERYINGEMYSYFYSSAFETKIDNLVKEMTEQRNG